MDFSHGWPSLCFSTETQTCRLFSFLCKCRNEKNCSKLGWLMTEFGQINGFILYIFYSSVREVSMCHLFNFSEQIMIWFEDVSSKKQICNLAIRVFEHLLNKLISKHILPSNILFILRRIRIKNIY